MDSIKKLKNQKVQKSVFLKNQLSMMIIKMFCLIRLKC